MLVLTTLRDLSLGGVPEGLKQGLLMNSKHAKRTLHDLLAPFPDSAGPSMNALCMSITAFCCATYT